MSETIPDTIPFEVNLLHQRYAQEIIHIDQALDLELVAVAALNEEGIFEVNFGSMAEVQALEADLRARRAPLIRHLGLIVTIPSREQLLIRRQTVQELLSDGIAPADA